MSKLGFVSEIRIDKKASDTNINDYLKQVGKDSVLKTSFAVDSESLKTITNQLKEFSNFKIGIGDNGIESLTKTLVTGFGQIATYTDKFNKDTEEWEQKISVSSDRLKVQEEIYGRIRKLMKEKGKLERESITLQDKALALNVKDQEAIQNQIDKYESFIDKEDLFNLAEYMKLVDQLKENQSSFDMAWEKNSQVEDKKRELEIEKEIAKQEKERQKQEQKAQQEKKQYLDKYANDYTKLLESQEKAEQKAFKDEQTSSFSRLVDLTKQRGELERNLKIYSGEQLNNAKEEYKVIKQSIKEQEKLIKNGGYEDSDLRKQVLEQQTQNDILMNRLNAKDKDNLQAQQYDKLIKATEKWYSIRNKMLNANEEDLKVYEKQKKIVESIMASSQSKIWNKSNGIRDEQLDKVVAQTREVGELQLEATKNKMAYNEQLEKQNKLVDELISDENKLFQLKKESLTATGGTKTEVDNQIANIEAKAEQKIVELQKQEILNEAKLEKYHNLKIENANKLKIINEKLIDQQEEEQRKVAELIELAQRRANVTLSNLMSGSNGEYANTDKLNQIKSKLDALNAVTTKEARSEINKLNLEIKELTSEASQKRLKNSVDGVNSLQQSFKSLTGYISGAMIIRELWQLMRQGVQYIKDLDEAFTDIAVSMDISREKFNEWTNDARKIAQANGVLTTSVMDMVKIYATAGESIEEIQDKLEGTAMIQNITQWDAEQTTSAVTSVINQYKLLEKEINGTTGNVANAISYMGDALIGISNELNIDNVAGIQEMVNAIDTAGGIMEQSGASMEWYMAIAGTLKETMNATGDEVGNAFKMISARVFAQAQAMEELGESSENIEIEMRKAEKALTSVGIAVRDASDPSQLRGLEEIMDELSGKWGNLSEATKQFVAEGVAGTNRRNYFVTMMENYDRVTKLTNAGLEAQGELAKANEVRVNSLAGQINILTDKMLAFMDSLQPVIYGGVQFANVILDIVGAFGAIPTVMTIVITSLLHFTNTGKALKTVLATISPATLGLKGSMQLLKSELVATQIQLVATTLKTVALQAAMTMGLSLAITGAISLITSYVSSLKSADERLALATESATKFNEVLSQSKTSELNLSKYKELNETLKNGNLTLEERNKYEEELSQVRNLLGQDEEIAKVLNNEKLELEEQAKWVEYILAKRKEAALIDLEETVSNTETPEAIKTTVDASVNDYTKAKEKQLEIQKEMNKALEAREEIVKNGGDTTLVDNRIGNYQMELDSWVRAEENAKTSIMETSQALEDANANLEILHENNKMTSTSVAELDEATQNLISSIRDEKLGIKDTAEEVDNLGWKANTTAQALSELNENLSDDMDASGNFIALGKELESIKDLIDEINENGLSYDSMEKVRELIPEIGTGITDLATVQEALNNKFTEMEDAQRIAYGLMYENSREYFDANVKDTDEWLQYQANVNSVLVQLEADMLSRKDTINNEHYEGMAELMSNDLKNANTLAQAKLAIHSKLMEEMLLLEEKFSEATMYEYDTPEARAINDRLQKIRQALAEVQTVEKDFLSGIKLPTYNGGSGYFGKDTSSSSSSKEKEVEDLEDIADAYYEIENALKDVNNALDLNNAKQENAKGKERVELMREEVELLKKKQQLLAQYQTEMEKERDSLKTVLQNNGFSFDDDGSIKNYQQRLKELQKWANSLQGDAKEEAIDFVENLIDVVDRYTDLVKSEIPQVIQDWEEMTTAIKEAEREQLEYVTQVQKDITSAIENELKKRTDAIKKELQKQQDLYNSQYEEEDYQDNLSKEQRKLDEIQQQINDASRDMSEAGKLRLKQLREEYLAQQEVINNMVRDWEKEQGNNAFDDAMDKADEELENALDPQNIADMVNKALLDGFVTIGDEVIELDTLMSNWLNETGDGLLAIGDLLRSELLDSLVQAGTLIGSITDDFNRIGATDVNVNTRSIPNSDTQSSPVINFNGSILTVEGDIAENMEDTLLSLIEKAKNEVMYTMQKALQSY